MLNSIFTPLALWRLAFLVLSFCAIVSSPASAAQSPQASVGFDAASELDFFKVESDIVTSVSRHAESLWGAAAAIYVVSSEDIADSGATSLAEALRLVPGLNVANVDANFAAISARGFNGVFANKLLVLLDGRPIYTPIFGGTVWHEWNTFLPDVDRIEVIRGPGGSLYGANAVNGVINIITRDSNDTRGNLARVSLGTNSAATTEARHGGRRGNLSYRVFGSWSTGNGNGGNNGRDLADEHQDTRAGYRLDWDLGHGLQLVGSGEFHDGFVGNIARNDDGSPAGRYPRYSSTMLSSVFRLEKDFADGSAAYFQLAGDTVDRKVPFMGCFETEKDTLEMEVQHSFRPHPAHRATWGANVRAHDVHTVDGLVVFSVNDRRLNLVGGFVQDEIDLGSRTRLTLGTKIENNGFTGTNFQPSARIVHRLDDDRTLWAAASRAINTPSYSEMYSTIPLFPVPSGIPGVNIFPILSTDGNAGDTRMVSLETGYRHRFGDRLALDIAAFYNDYQGLAGWTGSKTLPVVPDPLDPTKLIAVTLLDNDENGFAYGGEGVATVQINDRWRSELNVGYLHLRSTGDLLGLLPRTNLSVPRMRWNMRHVINVNRKLRIVPTFSWSDSVVNASLVSPGSPVRLDPYLRVDLAVHYKPGGDWPDFSLVATNLADRNHLEFVEDAVRPATPITRAFYLRASKEF